MYGSSADEMFLKRNNEFIKGSVKEISERILNLNLNRTKLSRQEHQFRTRESLRIINNKNSTKEFQSQWLPTAGSCKKVVISTLSLHEMYLYIEELLNDQPMEYSQNIE